MKQNVSFEPLIREIFETLAVRFPISCSSDEFFYFPHIRLNPHSWHQWDDFSPSTISDTVRLLNTWIDKLNFSSSASGDKEEDIDRLVLKRFCRVLLEQLTLVRMWQRQPSFYLHLANIGLAEALSSTDTLAGKKRAEGLPDFLDQAKKNLADVPALYRDIAQEMIIDTKIYYLSLKEILPVLSHAEKALTDIETYLNTMKVHPDFHLPDDVLERIFTFHLDTDLDFAAIGECIEREIDTMQSLLHHGAKNNRWQTVIKAMPAPSAGKGDVLDLYRSEIDRLLEFCLNNRLFPPDYDSIYPVSVATVPHYLKAIRTASSYSIIPTYPSPGGTFNIYDTDQTADSLREYKMLTAHEIYPGHHLLDTSRLRLDRPVRRHIERPLFYEGWACFAEELLWIMKYFTTHDQRLLLAKRRYWRAVRGKIDLELHSGKIDLAEAATLLKKSGRSDKNVLATVKKYTLNPGYQICYTAGLSAFLSLFEQYGKNNQDKFVQTILSVGEIGFTNLEKYLNDRVSINA